jgi:hypothetical protein
MPQREDVQQEADIRILEVQLLALNPVDQHKIRRVITSHQSLHQIPRDQVGMVYPFPLHPLYLHQVVSITVYSSVMYSVLVVLVLCSILLEVVDVPQMG